jgi:hypothetical protein
VRFIIPINEVEEGGSQTIHIVDTRSDCARTNKRKLREYFRAMGVREYELKKVFKSMGFVGEALGR